MKKIIPIIILIIVIVGSAYFLTRKEETRGQVHVHLDERVTALGVTITPHEVLEDSRCPTDVVCVWAGTVRVRTTFEGGLGTAMQVFELQKPVTTEAEIVTLVDVEPAPESTKTIKREDYIFVFEIQSR